MDANEAAYIIFRVEKVLKRYIESLDTFRNLDDKAVSK